MYFVGDVKIFILLLGFFFIVGIDGYVGWISYEVEEGFFSLELLFSDDGVWGGIFFVLVVLVDCGVSMFKVVFFVGDFIVVILL